MGMLRLPLVAGLAGLLAVPAMAAENDGDDQGEGEDRAPVTIEPGLINQLEAEEAALYLEAEALYQQALARYQKAHHVEARELIERAIKVFPGHRQAQELRQKILAVLSARPDTLQATTSWLSELKSVGAQEQAVRIAGLVREGDEALSEGDFRAAHRAYDQAAIAMRTFAYEYDWGDLPAQVQEKLIAAENAARRADLEAQREARGLAQQRQRELAEMEEAALKRKVDEVLRRAREAYKRRDFRRTSVLAWNAYEMDRRRDDARSLYLKSRRKGHDQFDEWYQEERDERLARANELMHQSLIPQTDLLLYPKDWLRRSQREPASLGRGSQQETWMAEIRDQLEQQVTVNFDEAELEDVRDFLQRTTGVNIVIATDVFADAGVPPITLAATDMKLRTALNWIMEITRLKMSIRNQAIYISGEDSPADTVLRLYDISDLMQPVKDFEGVNLGYNASEDGGFEIIGGDFGLDDDETDPEDIMDFIAENVAPDRGAGGAAIDIGSSGTLFVSQTLEIHDQIDQLLGSLRNQSSLQVQIQIRLLNVRKTFFEDIGVDWPIMQNINADEALVTPGSTNGNINPFLQNNLLLDTAESDSIAGSGPGLTWRHSFNYQDTLTGPQVELLLRATEQETDAHSVISPEITCYNGQRANASFVRQVAYIRDYDIVVSGDDNGTPDPDIAVLNVGNIIDVRPIVSSDRKYITMEVRPASSELDALGVEQIDIFTNLADFGFPLTLEINLPRLRVRTMRSTVMLPDRGSVVVGGMTNAKRERAHSGIPFVSHIPFLGRLFGRNAMRDENQTLYYIVSAEILDLAEREARQ